LQLNWGVRRQNTDPPNQEAANATSHRLVLLRSTIRYNFRRASPRIRLSLSRVPAPHGQRLRCSGAISSECGIYQRKLEAVRPRRRRRRSSHVQLRPNCGSTVYYTVKGGEESIAIPVGPFAEPSFPVPRFSVYEDRMHSWVSMPRDMEDMA